MPLGIATDVTAVDEVITALVDAFTLALDYNVYDGPPTQLPPRSATKFVSVGCDTLESQGEESPPVDAAVMSSFWKGLGQVAREEDLRINCVAVGRADTVRAARGYAMQVVKDCGQNIPLHPTHNTYNALVAEVVSVKTKPATGGSYVHVHFIIQAKAQLY